MAASIGGTLLHDTRTGTHRHAQAHKRDRSSIYLFYPANMAASIALTLALAAIGCVAVPGGPFASAFVPSCPNPSTSLRGPPTLALAAAAAAAAGEGEGGGSGHIPLEPSRPGGGGIWPTSVPTSPGRPKRTRP